MGNESENTNKNTNEQFTPRTIHSHSVKLVISAIVILLAGMVIGSASTMIIVKTTRISKPTPPEHSPEQMARRINRYLNLTKEQSAEVLPVIENHLRVLWHIRMGARPVITAQLNEMREDIEPLLNKEQQRLWKRNVKKLQEGLQYSRPPRYGQHGYGRGQRRRQMHRGPEGGSDRPEPQQ